MTVKHWNTGAAAARFRIQAASVKQIDLKIKKALKDGAYKRWKKLLKQKASSIKLGGPAHNQAPDFVKKKI